MPDYSIATSDGRDVNCQSVENTRLLEFFTPELVQACRKDLAVAKSIAKDHLFWQRVEFYSKGFHYTELTVAAVRAAKKLEAMGIHLFPS